MALVLTRALRPSQARDPASNANPPGSAEPFHPLKTEGSRVLVGGGVVIVLELRGPWERGLGTRFLSWLVAASVPHTVVTKRNSNVLFY